MKERIEQLEKALDASTNEINGLRVENTKLNETIADKDALIQSLKNSQVAVNAVEALQQFTVLLEEIKGKEAEKEEMLYNMSGDKN